MILENRLLRVDRMRLACAEQMERLANQRPVGHLDYVLDGKVRRVATSR